MNRDGYTWHEVVIATIIVGILLLGVTMVATQVISIANGTYVPYGLPPTATNVRSEGRGWYKFDLRGRQYMFRDNGDNDIMLEVPQ